MATKFMINKTAVKELVSENKMNLGGDVCAEVEELCIKLIKTGMKRAEANGRKTVQAKDL